MFLFLIAIVIVINYCDIIFMRFILQVKPSSNYLIWFNNDIFLSFFSFYFNSLNLFIIIYLPNVWYSVKMKNNTQSKLLNTLPNNFETLNLILIIFLRSPLFFLLILCFLTYQFFIFCALHLLKINNSLMKS